MSRYAPIDNTAAQITYETKVLNAAPSMPYVGITIILMRMLLAAATEVAIRIVLGLLPARKIGKIE